MAYKIILGSIVKAKVEEGIGFIARIVRFFPDHEIYARSGGQMRFLRITSGFQMKTAALAFFLVLAWLVSSVFMVGLQLKTAQDRLVLGAQREAVSRSADRVEAWRSNVDGIADRLETRQQMLEQMVQRYFGKVEAAPAPAKVSSSVPEAASLAKIEAKQLAFAETLTMAAAMRAQQTEKAIRAYGLDPRALAQARPAMGGPFIPVKGAKALTNLRLARLATSLRRLDMMERTLMAVPNTAPAMPLTLSSRFGIRSDPFTGSAALHAGLDITGAQGQSIFAAAPGRVVSVGRANGYGNLVVIDHGHGLETRYGHLSGFAVKRGQMITRGQQIAFMGSTGRSTGTHLHFEVRVNGRALNPKPFLEAHTNVLKVQDGIRHRFSGGGQH